MTKVISIVGIVGIPASYGGFETLAENLIKFHYGNPQGDDLYVFCSSVAYRASERKDSFLSARLKYLPISANGALSTLYDTVSLLWAVLLKSDVILVLGVSGALIFPLIKIISKARIIVNVDGVEWRRSKWKGFAKLFLRFSERVAVRFSDVVIADNLEIERYLREQYRGQFSVIAYGGDHAIAAEACTECPLDLPERYGLTICRIEPENNVEMIISAFLVNANIQFVAIGNWNGSAYGRGLRRKYGTFPNIHLVDPIYDIGVLRFIRARASVYVHGHSAGGTNPSLVEMMHFGVPVLAFDCAFNRATTENNAMYFKSASHLGDLLCSEQWLNDGKKMTEIARRSYTWSVIAEQYFSLFHG